MRTSLYKQEILAHFKSNHLLSLKDLESRIPEADSSTLFRNVRTLVDSGDLKGITVSKNKVLYERSTHKHDHFVCDDCESVEAVHLPRPKRADFEVRELIARGTCTDCNTKTA